MTQRVHGLLIRTGVLQGEVLQSSRSPTPPRTKRPAPRPHVSAQIPAPFPALSNPDLIGELGAVDRLATSAVVVGEVAALAHEARDHAVERRALEAKALLAGAERAEVLCKKKKRPATYGFV